jgi:6-phosphogluconolactonase
LIRLEVVADADAVADRAAAVISAAAGQAIASRGTFGWAVSGGRTPRAMLQRLALPWPRTTTHQVDERVAPAGHADRNLTALQEALPPEALATVRPMPVEDEDLSSEAERYSRSLPERLDLVHLGLGADGHTASLVPGDLVLEVHDRDVAVTDEYRGRRRMTLTYPALDRAREVLWVVQGSEKAEALERLLAGDRSMPAGRVVADVRIVVADEAAAADRSRD